MLLPSPHALTYIQVSFYNCALKASVTDCLSEIDLPDKKTKIITIKKRLQESIQHATAKVKELEESKGDVATVASLREGIATNQALYDNWGSISTRWLRDYEMIDKKRDRMKLPNDPINYGLAYRTRKFEMIARIQMNSSADKSNCYFTWTLANFDC